MRRVILTGCAGLLVALFVWGCGNFLGEVGEKSMSKPDPAKRDAEKAQRQ